MNRSASRLSRRGITRRLPSLAIAAVVVGLTLSVMPVGALGAPAVKTVTYHGYRLVVPASWPVYRLADDRTACVRFNRHAVYLGQPGADQRCQASPVGRTEAVLVAPLVSRASAARAGTGQPLPLPSASGAVPAQGSVTRRVSTSHGVVVTATWNRHPSVIKRALGVRSLPRVTPAASASPVTVTEAPSVAHAARAKSAGAASVPGGVFTGEGFDACSTPSQSQMTAWGGSPYRAAGVYIGGTNMACSQPNLTPKWVVQQSDTGWHLIPIYVGLQAPSNGCGCASMSSSNAAAQGSAAARDAVAKAQAVGLDAGNPIYDDMEGYSTTSSNTSAVLTFLAAWTAQLHASGYKSGVYSSASSGIRDLASRYGTGYKEPDDLWIANWNGAKNTADANVPSADWASHQRLHQYQGDHNETYRGATINIDGDYVDAATAAAGTGTNTTTTSDVAAAPSLSVSPEPGGPIDLRPSWSGAAGVSAWRVLGGASATSLTQVVSPVRAGITPIVIRSAFTYFEVQALDSDGQTLGSSPIVATRSHVAVVGQSAFVPGRGLAGLPVGCFKVSPCAVTTTISSGRTTIARTGVENIAVGGGVAYFKLSASGRKLLRRASHHRLAIKAVVRDSSGFGVTRRLSLVPYTTTGASPRRTVSQSPVLRIIGTADFVSNGWSGGILAVCASAAPCRSTLTLSAAGKAIAKTKPQYLGAGELGYLSFKLSAAGHKLLLKARGNQLPVSLKLTTAPTGVPVSASPAVPTDTTTTSTTTTSTTSTTSATGGAGAVAPTSTTTTSSTTTTPGTTSVTTAPAGTTSAKGTTTTTTATARLALSLFH